MPTQHEQLLEMCADLVEWAARMGGFEDPIWGRAKALVKKGRQKKFAPPKREQVLYDLQTVWVLAETFAMTPAGISAAADKAAEKRERRGIEKVLKLFGFTEPLSHEELNDFWAA